MTARRRRAERLGRWAEWLAAAVLTLKGYRILEMRRRTPVGEIDLVARKGEAIVFVEVKARADHATALNAITATSRHRIERAARLLLSQKRYAPGAAVRFDAILFYRFGARHLKDAWRPSAP